MRFDSTTSRNGRKLRNYLSRREQYRVLALVLGLGLVLGAMRMAADPQMWSWLVTADQAGGDPDDAPPEDGSIDARRRPRQALPPQVFSAPGRTAITEGAPNATRLFDGVESEWLDQLRDDTVFRSAETEAWYGMLGLVRDARTEDLARQSVGNVGFSQLYQQPDAYRGRAVTLAGTIRRCHYIEAHTNQDDVRGYFRCWIWPEGATNPVVVYCLSIPTGFPQGMTIEEPATACGLFYKRWAYKAVEDIRVAPLVVAQSIQWSPNSQAARPTSDTKTAVSPTEIATRAEPVSVASAEDNESPVAVAYDDFLKLFELSPTDSLPIRDGVEVADDEWHVIKRCLAALSRLPPHLAVRWEEYETDWRGVLANPERYRCRLVSLHGRLHDIETTSHLSADADPSMTGYRATIEVGGAAADDGLALAECYLSRLPAPWLGLVGNADFEWDERISATALFVKCGPDNRAVLVADRVRWHPDRPQPLPPVDRHHVALANLGMDCGLLYDLTGVGRLTANDAPAFYGALAAMKRSNHQQLVEAEPFDASVVELLQHSASHLGNIFRLTGTARRILKIQVDDPIDRETYGIDHYYEIELFVDPNAIVRIRGERESEDRVFSTYPVVFCCASLPASCPQGEQTNVAMSITGAYLKTWQYESQFMSGLAPSSGRALQASPLLVGRAPVLVATAQPGAPFGFTLGIAFIAVLLVASTVIWRTNVNDQKIMNRRRERSEEIPASFPSAEE